MVAEVEKVFRTLLSMSSKRKEHDQPDKSLILTTRRQIIKAPKLRDGSNAIKPRPSTPDASDSGSARNDSHESDELDPEEASQAEEVNASSEVNTGVSSAGDESDDSVEAKVCFDK